MSLTSLVSSSDSSFKLAQKIVSSLAEKFAFKFEDGWTTISSRTIENVQKRMKREKRRANPTSSIKHPRTSFSFFTQRQRPVSQAAHPTATFGELSRFVSEAWKALTPAQVAEFKALEVADKARYQTERTALLAATPVATESAAVVVSESAESPIKKEKKAKTPKAPATTEAAVVPATPVVKAAKVKATKAPAAEATPAVVPATPEVKAVKAPKAKKPEVAAPAAPEVAKEAKPASAPKVAKAPKAVKA